MNSPGVSVERSSYGQTTVSGLVALVDDLRKPSHPKRLTFCFVKVDLQSSRGILLLVTRGVIARAASH